MAQNLEKAIILHTFGVQAYSYPTKPSTFIRHKTLTQRAQCQYPLIREYSLNRNMKPLYNLSHIPEFPSRTLIDPFKEPFKEPYSIP